jgi:hypothetical protein
MDKVRFVFLSRISFSNHHIRFTMSNVTPLNNRSLPYVYVLCFFNQALNESIHGHLTNHFIYPHKFMSYPSSMIIHHLFCLIAQASIHFLSHLYVYNQPLNLSTRVDSFLMQSTQENMSKPLEKVPTCPIILERVLQPFGLVLSTCMIIHEAPFHILPSCTSLSILGERHFNLNFTGCVS